LVVRREKKRKVSGGAMTGVGCWRRRG